MSALTLVLIAAAVILAATLVLVIVAGRGGRIPAFGALRMARMSRLAAGFSASWFGAKVRRVFARGPARERLDAAARQRNAERLASAMGNMKGAFMKLGQMMSFVTDAVPKEYQAMLATLQAEAPPLNFPMIRDAVETQLGRPLERAFAEFDVEPIAAASIGQVHRARLPDGREVAVKVQYPGIARAIKSDLNNVGVLYRMLALMYPALDPKPVVAELRGRIYEELDYAHEAQNQRNFRQLYSGHPFFRIPKVIEEYSTDRILTSEFIDGRRLSDIEALDQAERDRYGEILYRFVFGTTLRFRAFNGDPHPGNYLFDADGKIVFLDFGLTKYFPSAMIKPWRNALLAYMADDKAGFSERLTELSFISPERAVPAEMLYDYFTYFYDCWRLDRDFTFTKEYNAKSFEMIFKPTGPFAGMQKKLNMPRDFVFINRIQWGVMSILASLDATGNWHRIHREYMFGEPPSTAMGEEIAAWRSKWTDEMKLKGRELFLGESGLNDENHGNFPMCWSA